MKYIKLIFWIAIIVVAILSIIIIFSSKTAQADENVGTNVNSTNYRAWSDISGWWDFHNTHTVEIGTSALRGYASSSIGDISLNCNTTRNGDICLSESNYAVTNASGSGDLAGCAWNDQISWISFSCEDADCDGIEEGGSDNTCASSDYGVSINSTGTFTGFAWNDVEGWISFNCANNSSCGTSDFKVATSWVPSTITGLLDSAVFNAEATSTLQSIIWQGSRPTNTTVDFQIATSSSESGPWTFTGPSGSTSNYYGAECPTVGIGNANVDKAICVDKRIMTAQYFRYRIRLQSDTSQTVTPRVDDIVLNFAF